MTTTDLAPSTALPTWNLDDLYTSPEAPELEADLVDAERQSEAFQEKYAGRLAALSGAELGKAVASFETILDKLFRVMSYAQLLHAGDMGNADIGRFYQTLQERVTGITTLTLFFTLEINHIEDARLSEQLADAGLQHYAPWIQITRAQRPHQLADELEKLLHEKSVTGGAAWSRLFDETMADMRFDVAGKELTMSDVQNQMSDPDGKMRETAARALSAGLKKHGRILSLITNTLAKDKQIEDGWRKYSSPMASRNLANQVEDQVVDALASAVRENYGDLSHRYFALKAKWFGQEKLDWWDRNAPLPDADSAKFSWDQAKQSVLSAYGGFAPEMATIAGRFFDERWIDAPPRAGKNSGAFAHPTVASAHPYILLNFHGKTRDVMTLAHELGHGVHQVLAAPQGTLMANTPLTLAETASVFGEMLTFQSLLKNETDPRRKRVMLAGKVEDMMNTVVRQIAFHTFECRVHGERVDGEISAERLAEIWMETQRESLGPVFTFDVDYKTMWGYIPHFVHSPFYVYAYAFGDCLVNSLYSVFKDGHPGFQEKYFEMLKSGGTKGHRELLAPFGLDASDPDFWKRGLSVISGFIGQLEAMAD
ncbi:MAG: M3 family oligoendopeptidase [Rhodospirillales bacterium]|nr:M3 family oligoendopeptidase [Rhodospirillales bacterium]